jgi:hypothetical protein
MAHRLQTGNHQRQPEGVATGWLKLDVSHVLIDPGKSRFSIIAPIRELISLT